MRTANEIKDLFLSRLQRSLQRPGMYGYGSALGNFYCWLLQDIYFIDGYSEYDIKTYLDNKGYWSSVGVQGFLWNAVGKNEHMTDDLAAVYAETAFAFGYLQLDELIAPREWQKLESRLLNESALEKQLPKTSILEQFGVPSFLTSGSGDVVHCYCNGEKGSANWITFYYNKEDICQYIRRGTEFVLPTD